MKIILLIILCLNIYILSYSQEEDTAKFKDYLCVKTVCLTDYSDVSVEYLFYSIESKNTLNLIDLINNFDNRIIYSENELLFNGYSFIDSPTFMKSHLIKESLNQTVFYKTAYLKVVLFFVRAKIEYVELKKRPNKYIQFHINNNVIDIGYSIVSDIKLLTRLEFE